MQEAGKRGEAVEVHRRSERLGLFLVFRAVDDEDLDAVKAALPLPFSLMLKSQFGMVYCPACGAKLSSVIEKNRKLFDRIAVED